MAKPHRSKRIAIAPRVETSYVSTDERRAKGKALRDAVPRITHAGWKAQKGRRDPVELLSKSSTVCLFMAADDDPLFLQVKEARASVLEPYAGKSLHSNHGQRVVVGQRLMQTASDVFLGWTRGKNGRDVYVRQLRDMKMSAVIEDWDTVALRQYARMCAHALARAHARTGDAATISGYVGSGQTFDDAIGEFAVEYAAEPCRLSDVRAGGPRGEDQGHRRRVGGGPADGFLNWRRE